MSLLARFSLANRGLVALIAVVTTALGVYAVPSLKQQLLPSLEFPAAFIVAPYPGAAPEVVETQVTEPIENSLRGIGGLDTVISTSREGLTTVQVQYEFGTDLNDVVGQMQTALSRTQLPDGVDPQVIAGSTDDLPAVVLAAAGDGDERALAAKLRDTVVPELEAIEGVRGVELTGVRDDLVVITPDAAKLARAKLQPTVIGTALKANGVAVPAGAVRDGDRALPVQVGAPLTSVEELREVIVAPPVKKAGPVRLGDVATVSEQLAPATAITRTNGRESLGIAVTADPDGNAVDISHAVADRLADLRAATGAELTVVLDQAPFVEKSIETLSTEGLLGLIMAVVVILVFLLSVRSTVVTAVSIPLSVVVALIALWIGDYSLNLLTLGALTVAVGRVVDDSIVVLENIKRHLSYGGPKREAILTAVREVAGAVTASTLTTVAVFAPIALVGGFVGQLFAPFAITVTVALLASLLVSLTVIPVLAYWFLKPVTGAVDAAAVRRAAEERELRSPLQRAYLPVIRFATGRRAYRWATLAAGLLVLVGTFGLARQLETNFLDDSGQDTLNIRQELPVGTGLAGTDAAARRVEAVLADTPGVQSYQVTAGGGDTPWAGSAGNNVASYALLLGEETDAKEMRGVLRDRFAALGSEAGEITFPAGQGGASGNELAVVVRAADPEALAAAAERARTALAGIQGVEDVSSTLADRVPRVDVTVDREAVSRAGLTEAAVGQLVSQAFRGTPLGQLTIDGDARDVVLRLSAQPPATVEELRALPVGPLKLDDVADVVEAEGPQQVRRIDGERSVTVTGTVAGSDLGAISTELQRELDAIDVPGATLTLGGVSAEQRETFADLGLAVLAAIAIVFLIMMATFRSVVQALILLVSIPFAATGAVALLLATGTALSVPALIGVLMLVGIVVTNAIVLLDLVNQYRARGMGVREAVVEGGRHRLRPILMTAIATIFALTPMAFGLTGEGGFISRPLALVVIGGLLSSTLLTLILVPTLYAMVEDTKMSWGAWRRRRFGAGGGDERPASEGAPAAGTEPDPTDRVPVAAGVGAASAAESRPVPAAPSGALIENTDQFEVLRLPKGRNSPFPKGE
ncbi:hydrophobic/amphiphilic exporter-1, HAE1 family [Micromonospora phaseoli]|uniref:Hydrophobic/amphiphilic exporter-1, HAE1 family n=1 Tax=Micromonospora phaseoli TaxID=1144548 RepID=A0A1H6WSP5_9ACTN|nr:efflux RND transporter permease subunit [Micromonospora phaseoli]PZW01783.1 HAE1 family hydrophobic/amphiphilic exporter-1 [Micromonospora phaseoli]GIJ78167.1 hydrogenase expression protein [Micromonospora phaseoli]SEJ15512.1 hydrophobic/amphiphilic exporter-1, HAE1 family [Micromonospora phaseoli]